MIDRKRGLFAVLVAFAIVALLILRHEQIAGLFASEIAPLSASETALVGSWTSEDPDTGAIVVFEFAADRTLIFDGESSTNSSRWCVSGGSLVLQHKYSTIIQHNPTVIPAQIAKLELPSFLAYKESFKRSVSFSPDSNTMTLGPIPPYSPALTFIREARQRSPRNAAK